MHSIENLDRCRYKGGLGPFQNRECDVRGNPAETELPKFELLTISARHQKFLE